MKKLFKRAFTIVELVIVIAVIAILAAVLIPTFSNIVGKANLSADKQAVREMNMALAVDQELHGKPSSVEQAMKILANAGYDVDSWNPLAKGYQVYWFIDDNRCVLYNSTTRQVEYPSEYSSEDLTADKNAGKFYVYNQTYKKAISMDLNFSSQTSQNVEINGTTYESAISESYGTSTEYATAIVYKKDSSNDTINVKIEKSANPTASAVRQAEKAAGNYVYAIFQQLNNKLIECDRIEIEAGTTIDVSDVEWKPLKSFAGYFGVSDEESEYGTENYKPVVINGLNISSALSYSETYIAKGAENPIYLTGFIGALYGTATIENVRFENITIDHAATDRMTSTAGKDASNSAIIGGIVSGLFDVEDENGNKTTVLYSSVDVTIRNVDVVNCTINAVRRAACLVGFVGGTNVGASVTIPVAQKSGNVCNLAGEVIIDNCHIDGCSITSDAEAADQGGYAVAGGILGFINKDSNLLSITISNCSCINSSFSGARYKSNGIVGDYMAAGSQLYVSNCTVSNNTWKGDPSSALIGISVGSGSGRKIVLDGVEQPIVKDSQIAQN